MSIQLLRVAAPLALLASVHSFASTPVDALWPKTSAVCVGEMELVDSCEHPDMPDSDYYPTCEDPTKHKEMPPPSGKRSGGCTERCMCPYYHHEDDPPYKGDPDDRPAIWNDGTGRCMPYEACPICSILNSMTDVQALNPPEWCNKGERKTSKAKCEQAYFTLSTGVKYRCKYFADEGKCKADEDFTC